MRLASIRVRTPARPPCKMAKRRSCADRRTRGFQTTIVWPVLVALACAPAGTRQRSRPGPEPTAAQPHVESVGDVYQVALQALFQEGAPDSVVVDAPDAPSPPLLARTTFGGSPILDEWSPELKAAARVALEGIERATPDLVRIQRALEALGIQVLSGDLIRPPTIDDILADSVQQHLPRLRILGVGFSADSTAAALYAFHWCGGLCATGISVLLARQPDGTWVVLNTHVHWVS